ncbi:raucaffricine-O-beta-D-glucosidase-like isoform X2 [Salvia splendens]|uniref:raucaffricine-O-beta-D-glucosidase-like isoform X2 n=2 Tax=Salvia splendens TaxID=180675 RepID=UPI001C254449|nr:raucaffricine-O-beta-D-glucosidase-like isoform X2 [Salvia splendens]
MAIQGVEMVHLDDNSNVVVEDQTLSVGASRWWVIDGPVPASHDNSGINHHWFPQDFVFGTGTAAFQVEGAAAKGGKGISTWDDFTMRLPWKIADGSNGNVACDMYNRYKEDIAMMKHMGFNSYRFSISWPRILPAGRCSGGINKKGIAYYNDVINTVLQHDMTPFVTLFHWDLPLCLEKEYGGFLSKRIKDDFREYAEVCFWEFGDRVKQWTTVNEPWTYAVNGYVRGSFAPGHKVPVPDERLSTKIAPCRGLPLLNSATGDKFINADPSEAYTVGRNLLLAHAEAVDLYRSKFQEAQGGKIGIVLNSHWFTPFDEHSAADVEAALRGVDFMFGWLYHGGLKLCPLDSCINHSTACPTRIHSSSLTYIVESRKIFVQLIWAMAMVHLDDNNNGTVEDRNSSAGGSTWWDIDGPVPDSNDNSGINHNWFPQDFLFGTGTSAFQVEGAAAKGGKGISIWDDFSMRLPWKVADGSNGNVACDMYNRYKEDISMMKKMGFNSYRFSISWARILPAGRCSGGINKEGIAYYNDVINTLLQHDIKPFVTLYHWDLPLCLENEYGGLLSNKIKDDFREFAEVCFWEFGDRVKHWTTLNEPWTCAVNGYVQGFDPPAHKVHVPGHNLSTKIATDSTTGDKFITADPSEAYTVAKNLLLAHAEAVDVYRSKFQEAQGGKIGIVLNSHWFTPFDEHSATDGEAALRGVDFMLGWFLEPIMYGHYPKSMEDYVPPDNLPLFTPQEVKRIQGSYDFVGLNFYTAQYASDDPHPPNGEGYYADQRVKYSTKRGDEYIGTKSGAGWLYSVPKGIYEMLLYMNDKYPELKEIYITENGFPTKSDHTKTAKMVCDDDHDRTKYHQDHLANMLKAMKHKDISRKLKGYFAWSWCDNLEWGKGFTLRFGLVYIDYMNDLTRYPKNSAAWFAKFLKSKGQPPAWFSPWWVTRHEENEENVDTDKGLKFESMENINRH